MQRAEGNAGAARVTRGAAVKSGERRGAERKSMTERSAHARDGFREVLRDQPGRQPQHAPPATTQLAVAPRVSPRHRCGVFPSMLNHRGAALSQKSGAWG
ncbi:MAG: hypothetical protein AMXMBFR58_38170 [Phycisphaerae bacterium]